MGSGLLTKASEEGTMSAQTRFRYRLADQGDFTSSHQHAYFALGGEETAQTAKIDKTRDVRFWPKADMSVCAAHSAF
jgi:hypothetical protein